MLFLVGYLADWFQERKILTTSQVRRYFNCLAFVSQTTFMMLAAYQKNRVLIIVFITFGASLGEKMQVLVPKSYLINYFY